MRYLLLLFSHAIVSNSLKPRGLEHARPPCPSPSPKVCPSSCPLHWWCHPAISSFDARFSFCPQSFPALGTSHIRWPKYWSFSFSISPSNEYLGLISLKIDWFGLLAVQGTLRSLLQHHSSKASILWRSTFFMVQLYWEPWISHARKRITTVAKVPGGNPTNTWNSASTCVTLLFQSLKYSQKRV